jgi:hypothetical protein
MFKTVTVKPSRNTSVDVAAVDMAGTAAVAMVHTDKYGNSDHVTMSADVARRIGKALIEAADSVDADAQPDRPS